MDRLLNRDAMSENMGEEEVLGLMMAEHFRWNGVSILEAAAAGLEDANYHRECEIILGVLREAKQTNRQRN